MISNCADFLSKRLPIDKVFSVFRVLETRVRPALDVVIRIWIADIFFHSGLVKLTSWSTTLLLFSEEYQVPFLPSDFAAVMATGAELIAPVLLLIGLGARFAAIPLLIMTAVIQFTYLDSVEHVYWAILLGRIIVRGAGEYSIDHLIRKKLEEKY